MCLSRCNTRLKIISFHVVSMYNFDKHPGIKMLFGRKHENRDSQSCSKYVPGVCVLHRHSSVFVAAGDWLERVDFKDLSFPYLMAIYR